MTTRKIAIRTCLEALLELGSNQRPVGKEPTALPLSYRAALLLS